MTSLNCGGVEELVVGVEGIGLVLAFEGAFGPVERGRDQRGAHVLEADAARRQRPRVDLDMRRIGLLAEDARLGHARHGRELLRQDRVGVIVDPVDRQGVGRDRIDQHRPVGRIGFSIGWRRRQIARQQPARRVDRLLHVRGGGVDVALEIELQRDRQRADPARRGHLAQRRDRRELLLQRGRHRRGHRVRAGAGVIDRDHDGREIDLGQRRHRQQPISADAEHQDAQHQQRRCDRTANEWCGDIHDGRLSYRSASDGGEDPAAQPDVPGAGSAILTRAPSVSRYCPSTTTFSPIVSPLLMTAIPSCVEATSTVRRSTVLSGLMT